MRLAIFLRKEIFMNKNKRLIFLFLSIFIIVTTCMSSYVSAETISDSEMEQMIEDGKATMDDIDSYAKEKLGTFKYGIYCLTKWARVSIPAHLLGITKNLFSGDIIKTISTSLSENGAPNYVSILQSSLSTIGRLICLLYFLLELIENATRDSFTLESFVKSFAKLMILFVLFSPSTLQAISNFGSSFADMVLNKINPSGSYMEYESLMSYITELDDTSWIKSIGFLFSGFAGGITIFASLIVCLLMAVGRAIEISLYSAFLPVGASSIFNGGLRSPGFRYIKKYIALHLQGAVMYLSMIIGFYANAYFNHSILMPVAGVMDIVIALCITMIMVRSKNISNDIMGV